MRRKIIRLALLCALAIPTVLAAGANPGRNVGKNATAAGAGQPDRQAQHPEAQKLAEALRGVLDRSTEDLTVIKREGGTETVDLRGRFQTAYVVRVNADGTRSEACVTSAKEAASFFTRAQTPADAHAGRNHTGKALK